MSKLFIISMLASILPLLYSIKKNAWFFAFSYFSLFFLGVAQVELLLYTEAYNIKTLFVFNVDRDSLCLARIAFLIINCVGIIFLCFVKNDQYFRRAVFSRLNLDRKGFFLASIIVLIILISIMASMDTQDTGRPSFRGIGIALGLLLPFSLISLALSSNIFFKVLGGFGLATIFSFSRVLGLVAVIAISVFYAKKYEHLLPSKTKALFIGVVLLLFYFVLGQFKHLIGAGVQPYDALLSSINISDWLFDLSFGGDKTNLSLATNYTIGIELGAEVAACFNDTKSGLENFVYTFQDLVRGFFPSFVRDLFFVELAPACNVAVIKSVLVDFVRSFGMIGSLIFSIALWAYVYKYESLLSGANSEYALLMHSILGCLVIFLIRGSIGAFVAFYLAIFIGMIASRLCLSFSRV